MPIIYVEGGGFNMGVNGGGHEGPAHPVTLDGFYIGQFEVTQKQWDAVMHSGFCGGYACSPDPAH